MTSCCASSIGNPRWRLRSYRQVGAHRSFVHIALATAEHDFAALHHDIGLGEVAGEYKISLDEEDRHVSAPGEAFDDPADILDDRGLNPFGRRVEDQQVRP